ncbi:MAG: hypothetical protein M1823_000013 [Watsoniomyces obsoletus]|nr:MAG: hypothetical protein M1823_000013 [Watsoniomyces obsoletus]
MASSTPYFSFPFKSSVRSRNKRKRGAAIKDASAAKTGGREDDNDEDQVSDEAVDEGYEEGSGTQSSVDDSIPSEDDSKKSPKKRPARAKGGIIPQDWEQNFIAGYNPSTDGPLPKGFPHHPLGPTPRRKRTWGRRASEHRGPSKTTTSLRRHHISVLTTLLHRCLLDGDYDRAGRAWGLLLRSTINGKPPDLKSEGRWGIGAEILLRQDQNKSHREGSETTSSETSSSSSSSSSSSDEENENEKSKKRSREAVTMKDFDRAKDYYEQLILEWPHNPHSAKRTNALHLYPAMFGLWIYAAQQQHFKDAEGEEDSETSDDEDTSTESGVSSQEHSGRRRELREAEAIASRMDELMLSPPYSDSIDLWHLRGMVALWMADLYLPPRTDVKNGGWDVDVDVDGDGDGERTPQKVMQDEDVDDHKIQQDQIRRKEQLDRASMVFKKVRQLGGTVSDGVPTELLQEGEGDQRGEEI